MPTLIRKGGVFMNNVDESTCTNDLSAIHNATASIDGIGSLLHGISFDDSFGPSTITANTMGALVAKGSSIGSMKNDSYKRFSYNHHSESTTMASSDDGKEKTKTPSTSSRNDRGIRPKDPDETTLSIDLMDRQSSKSTTPTKEHENDQQDPDETTLSIDHENTNRLSVLDPRCTQKASNISFMSRNPLPLVPRDSIDMPKLLSIQPSANKRIFQEKFEKDMERIIRSYNTQSPAKALVNFKCLAATEKEALIKRALMFVSNIENAGPNVCESRHAPRQRDVSISHVLIQNASSSGVQDVSIMDHNQVEEDTSSIVQDTSMALLTPNNMSIAAPETPAASAKAVQSMVDSTRSVRVNEDVSVSFAKDVRVGSYRSSVTTAESHQSSDQRHKQGSSGNDRLSTSFGSDEIIDSPASSVSSIEQGRHTVRRSSVTTEASFATPRHHIRSQKRIASRSAKKGRDTARARLYNNDEGTDDDAFFADDEPIFEASQSPIQQNATNFLTTSPVLSPNNDDSRSEIDVSSSLDGESDVNDTIRTFSPTQHRQVRSVMEDSDDDEDDSLLYERPVNVSLRERAIFRMKPLSIRRNLTEKGSSSTDFPDPFDKYEGKIIYRRLKNVFKWIEKREASQSKKRAIVFSVSMCFAHDLIVKLILQDCSQKSAATEAAQSPNSLHRGDTLIVCRSKEDVAQLASVLREGTGCSVLDHAGLPMADRTSTRLKNQFKSFDVVISTYDAIMSKDVPCRMTVEGYVEPETDIKSDGWLSSRSSSHEEDAADKPVRVQKLSVLHKIEWNRLLFLDNLGRKSYLAKEGTLRACAAAAVNSKSRLAFFQHSDLFQNQLEALCKSDRKANKSVAKILRLPSEAGHDPVTANAVNLKNAARRR